MQTTARKNHLYSVKARPGVMYICPCWFCDRIPRLPPQVGHLGTPITSPGILVFCAIDSDGTMALFYQPPCLVCVNMLIIIFRPCLLDLYCRPVEGRYASLPSPWAQASTSDMAWATFGAEMQLQTFRFQCKLIGALTLSMQLVRPRAQRRLHRPEQRAAAVSESHSLFYPRSTPCNRCRDGNKYSECNRVLVGKGDALVIVGRFGNCGRTKKKYF